MHSENIAAYIGLDVHKETLAVAIAAPERLGEVRYYGTINNEAQAVRRLFQKLQGLYGNILSCYEAGPCGFGLYHQLTAMNIKCQVIAPSRIPKSPTDRIKNDHRDAISLARLLRAGELTPVWIPDLTHEAMRDLIRARAAAKRDSRVNRPGFPGECFICELRLPDHRFRWKHNKLFLLLPEEYGPAFPAIVDCYTSPPTLVWPVPLLHGFSSSYGVLPPLCKDH